MPKRTQRLPLTPASSTEITAMDHGGRGGGGGDLTDAAAAFALPPAAISTPMDPVLCNDGDHHQHQQAHHSTGDNKLGPLNNSSSSHQPLSPTSPPILTPQQPAAASTTPTTTTSRPRTTATKRSAPDLELPPPPTRARKIIQMKPKSQLKKDGRDEHKHKQEHDHEQQEEQGQQQQPPDAASHPNGKSSSKNNSEAVASADSSPSASPPATATATTKKKQNSGTTTATGRKVARKTAHSLIERRRRSKMNEEFGTLKDMIPACKGQDMHKLAILQGGIEYVTYLEQCIDDLKAANRRKDDSTTPSPQGETSPGSKQDEGPQQGQTFCPRCSAATDNPPPSQCASMPANQQYGLDQRTSRESFLPPPPAPHTTQPSPVALGEPNELAFPGRPSTEQQMPSRPQHAFQQSACSSTTTSPVVQPQETSATSLFPSAPSFGRRPGADVDREASAALLMLNKLDSEPRRNAKEPERKLGISVKDLLSH